MTNVKLILLIVLPFWLTFASQTSYGRHAAILVEADSGRIIYEADASHSWYPASLTKVMTLYIAFTALNQKRIHLHDTVTTSHHAARQPNSKLGLRTGETLTVQEAILAIITRSANDAAVALAEHIGGNEENFAVKMTATAHALGMYDSHFMNATGLPHQWQVTTPRDMALLAWRVQRDFPNFYGYFAAHSFYFRDTELRGINKFTAKYPGAEGMKTGFTCGSGYNLMSSAYQNNKRLIGVVLGGSTSAERYQLMTHMMDDGFADKFNPQQNKHITAIPAKMTSPAPYLLDCGNGAPGHGAAHHSRPKPATAHKLASKRKKVSKSKSATKAKSRHTTSKKPKAKPVKNSKTRYRHR